MTRRPLYLIIGPSGAGKDTIVDELCRWRHLKRVVSYTTRPKRPGEEDGKQHFFVSDSFFNDTAFWSQIAAHTRYDGYDYGATWNQIDEADLFVVDPKGADMLCLNRKRLHRQMYVIFIDAPEETRIKRMLRRGDSTEQVKRRIDHDYTRFSLSQMRGMARSLTGESFVNDGSLSEVLDKIDRYITDTTINGW